MDNDNLGPWGCGCLVVFMVFMLLFDVIYQHGTTRTVTFTVKSLDDQSTPKGHKYLVFTADNGSVYENTDAWLEHFYFDDRCQGVMLRIIFVNFIDGF